MWEGVTDMTAPTMVNGKQVAEEPVALEKTAPTTEKGTMPALGKKPFAFVPPFKEQPWLYTAVLSSVFATLTTLLAWVFMARRKRAPQARFLFGKPIRRFGYGHYRLGRFGTAWLAYTYKLPDVHYRLPELAYKLPPFWEKLPVWER
jgi:hypothetical protein